MLALRPTWPEETGRNDWCVYDDGQLVGRIYENTASPAPECRWFWALNGTAGQAHRAGVRTSGLDATLEDAKAAWRKGYDKWLAWAGREIRIPLAGAFLLPITQADDR
jgi:hypothetical protein